MDATQKSMRFLDLLKKVVENAKLSGMYQIDAMWQADSDERTGADQLEIFAGKKASDTPLGKSVRKAMLAERNLTLYVSKILELYHPQGKAPNEQTVTEVVRLDRDEPENPSDPTTPIRMMI